MNKWISVEDQLPKDGQRVLIYCPEGYYPLDVMEFRKATKGPDAWWIGRRTYILAEGDITHWMSLPKESSSE